LCNTTRSLPGQVARRKGEVGATKGEQGVTSKIMAALGKPCALRGGTQQERNLLPERTKNEKVFTVLLRKERRKKIEAAPKK